MHVNAFTCSTTIPSYRTYSLLNNVPRSISLETLLLYQSSSLHADEKNLCHDAVVKHTHFVDTIGRSVSELDN